MALVGALAAHANAGPTFIITKGKTMFRVDDNGTEQFTLNDALLSLTIDKNGALIGGSGTTLNDGYVELYELTGALGESPTLVQVGATTQRIPTLTNIQGSLYGITREPGGPNNLLFSMDDDFNISAIGHVGAASELVGSGYDPVNDKYYVADFQQDVLYDVDYTNATINESIDVTSDLGFQGAEWFEGQLWIGQVDNAADALVVGTLDIETGTFNQSFVAFEGVGAIPGTVAFTIVPGGCPQDCNADGALNILDFVCFQQHFVAGDDAADCNADGVLNVLDFVCFQLKFVEGCG